MCQDTGFLQPFFQIRLQNWKFCHIKKTLTITFLFFLGFSYLITFQSQIFYPQFTLRQLIQSDLESRFIVKSQLGPSILSGPSPCAGLQVLTPSTHLLKDSRPHWYRTHTVPKFCLQSSWIKGACDYISSLNNQ